MGARRGLRIGGIPIRVEWPFFMVAAILGISRMRSWPGNRFVFVLVWVALVFVSVLVHELGHATAYRLNGQRPTITLTAFWGLTHGERALPKWRSVVVSASGVIAGMLVLGIPAWLARGHFRDVYLQSGSLTDWQVYAVVYDLMYINLAWSLTNLLPLLPLDGGNIADVLWGRRIARTLSVVVGLSVAVWLFVIGFGYGAMFIGMLGLMNIGEAMQEGLTFDDVRHGRLRRTDGDGYYRASRPERPEPRHREPKAPRADRKAKPSGGRKRRKGPDLTLVPSTPFRPANATDAPRLEAAAWDALRSGDTDEAGRVLLEATGRAGVSPHLPAALAAAEGRTADAVELFTRAFAAAPTPPNLVVAKVIAKAGVAVPLATRLLAPGGPGPEAAAELQNHLHYADCFADAAAVGELLVADGRRSVAQSSFEVACSWSRAGDAAQGLRWLERAVDAGFTAPSLVDGEADLEPVRREPGFAELRARLHGTGT